MLRLGIFVSLILFVYSKSTQKASKPALFPHKSRAILKTQVNTYYCRIYTYMYVKCNVGLIF